MPVDATGAATSPDNIPKYNTANDKPTGLGLNNIVDSIQTVITQLKAGTLASGKLLASALSGIVPTANLGSGAASSSTFLRGDGSWQVPSVGTELAYAEITSNANITQTVQASATTCITCPAITVDGSTLILITVSLETVYNSIANTNNYFTIWRDTTDLSVFARVDTTASAVSGVPMYRHFRVMPAAGTYVFSLRCFNSGGTTTILASSGAGASSMRITKAA